MVKGNMFKVRFKGETLQVETVRTLEELKEALEKTTQVPPHLQRVVAKGGFRLDGEDDFSKLVEQNDGKEFIVQMFGTTEAELEKIQEDLMEIEAVSKNVRNDIDVDYEAIQLARESAARERDLEYRRKDASSTPYRFNSIRVLNQFKDSHKAHSILEDLATDPGFLAVLRKYKWTVGALTEMYPDGKVGVDPVCVLGVNINKGQEISLRLRTDDLRGFRKLQVIKETLCHELSHMQWSEHDSNFYQLMREIQKDVVQLDWRNGHGEALGGEEVLTRNYVHSSPERIIASPQAYRLGGSGSQQGSQTSLRERMATAAESRMTAHTKAGLIQTAEMTSKPIKTQEESTTSVPKAESSLEQSETSPPPQPPSKTKIQEKDEQTLGCPCGQHHHEPLPLAEDLQAKIEQALARLVERNSPETCGPALQLLSKIFGNIIKDPSNEKFRSLRVSNPKVKNLIDTVLGARHLLLQAGWTAVDDAIVFLGSSHDALSVSRFTVEKINDAAALVAALS